MINGHLTVTFLNGLTGRFHVGVARRRPQFRHFYSSDCGDLPRQKQARAAFDAFIRHLEVIQWSAKGAEHNADIRANFKLLGSRLIEEKSYAPY